MWPVHSELIEMGLHIHPVLLTLASTLKDGVVSMEDGLLAKVMYYRHPQIDTFRYDT